MNLAPPTASLSSGEAPPLATRLAEPDRTIQAVRAERRAWLILWLAFATFAVVAAATARTVADFISSAEIDFSARVEGSQGLVFVKRPTDTGDSRLTPADSELAVGTTMEASRGATATVRLFDETRMTLQSNSRVRLVSMEVGRFINRQSILMEQEFGPIGYMTASEMQVAVPGGTVILLPQSDVTVWVLESGVTRVLVYVGEARVQSEAGSATARVNQRLELSADQYIAGPLPRAQELLVNHDFSQHAEGWQPIDVQIGPADAPGQRLFVPIQLTDGARATALHIRRDSVALAHGETGLQQVLNLDVSGYRSLILQAWVRVNDASLSGGGQLGSEYPLMLVAEYEGQLEGSRPGWVHGFFAANPENRPVINAEQVPRGQWIAYRVNLMETDESQRPFRLLNFAVEGQGHSYDAQVAGLQLIGD